jgi:hypothetical protein
MRHMLIAFDAPFSRHGRDRVSGQINGRTAMSNMTNVQLITVIRPLTDDELTTVVGGDAKPAVPASKPQSSTLFEVEDYSFDIEQVR